jgi:predicted AlkP superfamily pyrophosphatase or phosphodiesterase
MKRCYKILVLLSLAIAALAVSSVSAQRSRASAGAGHVVIITVDGFGAWALDDPHLPVPTLRRLASRGAVAKGMRPPNPPVTWPNHTTIVTGVTPARHGVLFNGVLIQRPGSPPVVEPWHDRSEMVRVKTLYDLAHERGLTTAQVDWVAIQNAPTITWAFPERADSKGAIASAMIKDGLLSQADVDAFSTQNIVWRDAVWTEAASYIFRKHRPNLLLFHLLTLDSTQHRYGPRTLAATSAMAYLDSQIAALVKTIDASGLAPRTTIFVLSDHGFKTVKKQIRPNAAFEKAGLLKVENGKIIGAEAYAVPEGGTAFVYATRPEASDRVFERARRALASVEGIDKIIEPSEYGALGLPQPAANNQMAGLLLSAKEGYSFGSAAGDQIVADASEGSLGAHGYLATDPDLRALFIASGRGIKPGVTLDSVDNVDVAPTAARLLGFEMKDVDGKPLTQILSSPRAAVR